MWIIILCNKSIPILLMIYYYSLTQKSAISKVKKRVFQYPEDAMVKATNAVQNGMSKKAAAHVFNVL